MVVSQSIALSIYYPPIFQILFNIFKIVFLYMVEDLDPSERERVKRMASAQAHGTNVDELSRDLEACREENKKLRGQLDTLKKSKP